MESPKPLPSPPKNLGRGGSPGRKLKRHSAHASEEEGEEFEFHHEFSRSSVKSLIHFVSQELKRNALDIEYLFLPFRPEQSNEKLLKFLNRAFPLGNGIAVEEAKLDRLIRSTDPWTLFQALKYIWCRLPQGQVVTWKAYRAFQVREEADGFSPKSFLDLMPQCLSSPDHASIVYDFFDLIVAMAANSKRNKMSARKISKMFAVWAFGKDTDKKSTENYDFDHAISLKMVGSNSFKEGLEVWLPAANAMFHLLLAFIRSFVPHDLKDASIPMTLKTILFNNNYPPKDSITNGSETPLTVPIVSLKTNKFSSKPWQLIERCNELFDFGDHDAFEAREDYALLKSLFKKKHNIEGISHKMSNESRRLMKEMSTKHSTFQAGWASQKCIHADRANKPVKDHLQVKRVDINDYFIWAWLSSLSHEETSEKRKLFGRSIIVEFEFDGFKKWIVFEESDVNLELKMLRTLDSLEDLNLSKSPALESPHVEHSQKAIPAYEKFQKNAAEDNSNAPLKGREQKVLPSPPSEAVYGPTSTSSLKASSSPIKPVTEKTSSWNPLKTIRKISTSTSSSSSSNSNAPVEAQSLRALPEKKQVPSTTHSNIADSRENPSKRQQSRILSQFSMLNPENYQLPTVEHEDFKVDIPELDQHFESEQSEQQSASPPTPKKNERLSQTKGGLEDLHEMVDRLNDQVSRSNRTLAQSTTSLATNAETFETLTMFDRYKDNPKDSVDTLAESTNSSVVPPLALASDDMEPLPDIRGSDYTHHSSRHESPKLSSDNSPIVFPIDKGQGEPTTGTQAGGLPVYKKLIHDQETHTTSTEPSPIASPRKAHAQMPTEYTGSADRLTGASSPYNERGSTDTFPRDTGISYSQEEPTSIPVAQTFSHKDEQTALKQAFYRSPPPTSAQSERQAFSNYETMPQVKYRNGGTHGLEVSPADQLRPRAPQSPVPIDERFNVPEQRERSRGVMRPLTGPAPASAHTFQQRNVHSNEVEHRSGHRISQPQFQAPESRPFESAQHAPYPSAANTTPQHVIPNGHQKTMKSPSPAPVYVSAAPHEHRQHRPPGNAYPTSPIPAHNSHPPSNMYPRSPPLAHNHHPQGYANMHKAIPASMPMSPKPYQQNYLQARHGPAPPGPGHPPVGRHYPPSNVGYPPAAQQYVSGGYGAPMNSPSPYQGAFYAPVHAPYPAGPNSGPQGGAKLHGGYTRKREDRKKLHDTIKNGAFGI
ncbi:LAFA_0C04896g1_1 [Lachancea sp. 'fantastica']|nr:LAFA_0C04896g1_1 [Lachancea sp. 'fantastica']